MPPICFALPSNLDARVAWGGIFVRHVLSPSNEYNSDVELTSIVIGYFFIKLGDIVCKFGINEVGSQYGQRTETRIFFLFVQKKGNSAEFGLEAGFTLRKFMINKKRKKLL